MKKQFNLLKVFAKTSFVFVFASLVLSNIHAESLVRRVMIKARGEARGEVRGDLPADWGNGKFKFAEMGRSAAIFQAGGLADLHDIHVVLGKTPGKVDFQIVLGGWSNTQTAIRFQGKALPISQDFNFMNVKGDHSAGRIGAPNNSDAFYWALVDKNTGYIAVGQGSIPGQNIAHVVKTKSEDLAQLDYFGFSSYNRPIVYQNVQIVGLDDSRGAIAFNGTSQMNDAWQFEMPSQGVLKFSAIANRELRIDFGSDEKNIISNELAYRVVVGADNNTTSRIYKNGKDVFSVQKGIKNPGQLTNYWIKFDNEAKTITVGTGDEVGANVLMVFKDPQFNEDVSRFNFSSSNAVNIYNIEVAELAEVEEALEMAEKQASALVQSTPVKTDAVIPVHAVAAEKGVTSTEKKTEEKKAQHKKHRKNKKQKKIKKNKKHKKNNKMTTREATTPKKQNKNKKNKHSKKNKKNKNKKAKAPVAVTSAPDVEKK